MLSVKLHEQNWHTGPLKAVRRQRCHVTVCRTDNLQGRASAHRLGCPRSSGWSFHTSPSVSEGLECCSRQRRSAHFPSGQHLKIQTRNGTIRTCFYSCQTFSLSFDRFKWVVKGLKSEQNQHLPQQASVFTHHHLLLGEGSVSLGCATDGWS